MQNTVEISRYDNGIEYSILLIYQHFRLRRDGQPDQLEGRVRTFNFNNQKTIGGAAFTSRNQLSEVAKTLSRMKALRYI